MTTTTTTTKQERDQAAAQRKLDQMTITVLNARIEELREGLREGEKIATGLHGAVFTAIERQQLKELRDSINQRMAAYHYMLAWRAELEHKIYLQGEPEENPEEPTVLCPRCNSNRTHYTSMANAVWANYTCETCDMNFTVKAG